MAADAPSKFEATWRYRIDNQGIGAGEKRMLGKNFNPDAPRKFTKLHLLDTAGSRALRAQFVSQQWKYDWTNVMVQKKSADDTPLQSAYAAVIEPYAGEPFIQSTATLPIEGNQTDATRAVAVEVKTTAGRTDITFTDGSGGNMRRIGDAGIQVNGEYAFHSTDKAGVLHQATLVGGTELQSPFVRIQPTTSHRTGRVVKVDYYQKKLWLNTTWPRRVGQSVFAVGVPDTDHMTTYTAVQVEPASGGSEVTLLRGADYYRSRIESFEADGVVACTLVPFMDYIDGNQKHWVASNEDMTRFWRAEYLDGKRFKLTGGEVTADAFGENPVLRLWEYGVGDEVRQSTVVNFRRIDSYTHELTGDVDLTISLPAAQVQTSRDGKTWVREGEQNDNWTTLTYRAEQLLAGPVYVRFGPVDASK
jgi:hypothetical protein